MPVNVLMPALSPTMEKGKLAKWLKKEGDTVKSGDVLAEIETDKATMEVEAVDEGIVGKLLIAEGTDDVAVNTPIAVILGEGETAGDIKAAPPPAALRASTSPVKGEVNCHHLTSPLAGEVGGAGPVRGRRERGAEAPNAHCASAFFTAATNSPSGTENCASRCAAYSSRDAMPLASSEPSRKSLICTSPLAFSSPP